MSLSGFDRKRVERFAEFVGAANGPHTHRRTNVDDELSPLTLLTRRLTDLPMQAPDADFSSNLRGFLVATAERDGIGQTAAVASKDAAARTTELPALAGKTQVVRQVSGRGTGRTRLAVLAGVAAGAIVLSGVSAASTGALPGDPLYSVKRSTERAQLALAGSDASRGRLYLEFARSRMTEADQVDPSRVATVLADMNTEMDQGAALVLSAVVAGSDDTGIGTVTAFISDQETALNQLRNSLGTSLAPSVADQVTAASFAELNKIQTRVTDINRAITAKCSFHTADKYGPEPASTC
jgi:hypothetical protein